METLFLPTQIAVSWMLACGAAVVTVMLACSMSFGISGRTALSDLAVTGLAEIATPLVLSSPLDVAHLHGQSLTQWSTALGNALGILGILLTVCGSGDDTCSPQRRRSRNQPWRTETTMTESPWL